MLIKRKIYLAPMEGITTYIFRRAIAKYYGGIDRYYTPFLTASHLKGRELRDVTPENNLGMDVVPQILTNDSALFLTIARQLEELGYTEVNLNLGCPSGTVVAKGRGAGFLDKVQELDRFLYDIYAGCDNTKLSISIKTRLGMEFLSEWDDILRVYIKYPIKELIIHPRLRNEFYTGRVHIDEFEKACNTLYNESSFKGSICYNGDIIDKRSYKDILDSLHKIHSPINVMIGRGLIMNPNLAWEIMNSDNSEKKEFDKNKFRSFITEIMEDYIVEMSNEKQVVMKMKELWTYFAMGLGLDKSRLKEIHKVNKLSDYKNAVQMIFSQIY